MGDLLDNPRNPLSSFYLRGDIVRLSRLVFDEFGFHLYIESTGGGHLRIRMNHEEWKDRKSQEPEALDFFKRSPLITSFGDGIQAFAGLLLGVMSLHSKILLIDEPEAFLHPPAIRGLGRHYLQSPSKETRRSSCLLIVPIFSWACWTQRPTSA
jgi:hypothetical protein